MAESILVTGKKISSMELVTNVTGNEKIPTGQPDDLAVTPNQIADHTIARGDLASQEDLSQVEVSLGTQITDLANDVTSADNSIRGLIAAEEAARIAKDLELQQGLSDEAVLRIAADIDLERGISVISDNLSITVQTFTSTEAGVDAVTGVADGAYFNVRSTEDDTMLVEYQNVGGSAVATGKWYLSDLGVQLQDKAASTIRDESGKDQQEINNIIYKSLNLVENWGANGDGVTQDKTFVQAAIDDLHSAWLSTGKEQTLLFSSGKTYVLDGVTLKAGVHYATYGEGKARLLKTPATEGQTDAALKWRRMLSTSTNMTTVGNTIRHRIENIILDGNMDNMNWSFNTYAQEQGMCLIITGANNGARLSDRVKFELNNVEFINSVSDGVCVHTNADVVINNCTGLKTFRGGVTIVGGNSIVQINNWIGESSNIHIEVDGQGYGATFKTDLTVNGGEVDKVTGKDAMWGGYTAHVMGGASVIYNNFKCHSAGFDIFAGDTNPLNKIIFNNCTLSWNGGNAYNIPKLLQFNDCDFLSDFRGQTEVKHGWLPYWNTNSTVPTDGAEIVFNGGRALGIYDTPELAGSFIRPNLGGTTNDEIANPSKRVVFTGGFYIEGYAQPYDPVYGGISVKYDDVHVNTPRFLVGGVNTTRDEGNINIELGKLFLGSKNTQFYQIRGGAAGGAILARIFFNGTVIPLDKFTGAEVLNTYWDVKGQLTVTADNPTSVTLSNFKCFAGSRLVFINTVKGDVAECIAYPDATNALGGSKLTSAWSVSKMITNPVVSAQKTYDPPSIDAGAIVTTTVTLTGVALGQIVQAAFDKYDANIEITASVSSTNTVTVKFKNTGVSPVDLASGTLTVRLI